MNTTSTTARRIMNVRRLGRGRGGCVRGLGGLAERVTSEPSR
jgi:hypothetical protein